jgi:glycosyltransferase involved in cell wall biosynthesis
MEGKPPHVLPLRRISERVVVEPSARIDPGPNNAARFNSNARIDVLHVPFTYFPDPVGGTEIYVAALIAALRARGLEGGVAAPAEEYTTYVHEGFPVFRFARAPMPAFASAYGVPDEDAALSFRAVLKRARPRIVHLHARTAAVSDRLVEVAREQGAKVFFTYHTPTVSCPRGTMMRLGRIPCDGKLNVRRCAACVLQSHGVPLLVRDALASAPQALGEALGGAGLDGGVFTALRMSSLVGAGHRRFGSFMQKVDHVIAVCRWVADVLLLNGVPKEKLTLCRQGLPNRRAIAASPTRDASPTPGGALRLGYFGRLDLTKGVDLLIEAVRRTPAANVYLEIYGVRQPGSEDLAARLENAAAGDPRILMRSVLRPVDVIDTMRACNLVAVPSRWLETGPLVVLESFAAGTPVLGARLGGIAEIVTDGVDGVLVEPDDPAAWSSAIAELADNPGHASRLRAGVRPPRKMEDVASEMMALYQVVLSKVQRGRAGISYSATGS